MSGPCTIDDFKFLLKYSNGTEIIDTNARYNVFDLSSRTENTIEVTFNSTLETINYGEKKSLTNDVSTVVDLKIEAVNKNNDGLTAFYNLDIDNYCFNLTENGM